MTDWPATLPQAFEQDGFSYPLPDNRLRSITDVGVVKSRRRSSLATVPLSGRMIMDNTQRADLATFVNTTTAGGVLPFNFPDPYGGADLLVQFGDAMPEVVEVKGLFFTYQISLEVLP